MISYKPLVHIRAISFDLDDTLYNNMPYIEGAEKALMEYMAERYPLSRKLKTDHWQKIKRQVLQEQAALINDLGQLRTTVLTRGFIHIGMPVDEIGPAVNDCFDYFYFKRSDFKVAKKTRKILKKLASKVPLAAITNGNVNLAAIKIEKYFTCVMHACPEYPMKPHSAMFDYVSQKLNIPSKNILHVGDDLDKDIKGATDAGFQSAWLAVNRDMSLLQEYASVLPHIQLTDLRELKKLLKKSG